jgi:hypothetical protein
MPQRLVVVEHPVLADRLKEAGARRLSLVCLVVAPEGLRSAVESTERRSDPVRRGVL